MNNIEGGATLWARQTIDSEIFYAKPAEWFKIWFYLVNRVNWKTDKRYERGELFLKYEYIADATGTTKNQIDHFIRWAKECGMLATRKTTRGMIVKITNYSKYQTLDNYYFDIKSDTESETEAKQKRNRSDTILKKEKKEKYEKNNIITAENETNKILNIFYKINPTINFGHLGYRRAVEDLLKLYPIDQLEKIAEFAISVQGQPYTPVITNPYQLKDKLSQLMVYHKQRTADQKGTITFLK